ncbi:Bacterocin transport accessory protein [Streptococcus sp. DD10]|uniref:PedC/BrcD family bacteriocin maturation disulfide isomerase n=1 Tax=Streptococcus sp. DD10 TaxID=1777878 RepID=UPI000796C82F|nr:PedC/BrcD family bacteriocin maturation disulfide isomerase [Streptococcus sp. DD10]KXT75136.1 Bacterocin transport accessory protein [Streptococcus sp. DD10]
MEAFAQHISNLTETTVAHAQTLIDEMETATFFVGRATCPYCRKFAAKLHTVVNETEKTVYFINSEDPNQLGELQAFREQYGIKTVPGFVHTQDGDVTVRCDSSMSEEEIKEFAGF